ncbi:metallophosphoesterase [Candidatus Woesearchaeota archaeon]|nr:metallophosphoesterase [Candidatus Woesearchaeota archaeon]
MKIKDKIEIIDLALKLDKILIFADFHVGYEEALNKQGVLVPRFQFKDTMERLDKIFENIEGKEIETIIVNGDLKHEFGTISETEWRQALKIFDYLAERCKKMILIKGNHDKILGPIAEKRNLEIAEFVVIDDVLICHGDKIDSDLENAIENKNIKTIIIGHEHPAVTLRESAEAVRSEKYKCYLVGKYKGKILIVQPSFNLVTEGTDVAKERLLSPFLKQDLSKFSVFVVADKVYEFGKINNLE